MFYNSSRLIASVYTAIITRVADLLGGSVGEDTKRVVGIPLIYVEHYIHFLFCNYVISQRTVRNVRFRHQPY
jgi:hypothetical protein